MPIDPALIAQLIMLIVQILLKVFSGDHAKAAAYLAGRDIPWYRVARKWERAAEIRGLIIANWHGSHEQLGEASKIASAEFAGASVEVVKMWAMPEP
jgi:hypothetical protein